jgi:hypothetical protein
MQLNVPLKAIAKTWLIKHIATHLRKIQTDTITDEYKEWRHRFLLERLHLAAWITLIAYPTFVIMSLFAAATVNATGDPRDAVSQAQILTWLIDFAATELCVLLCLTLLRIKKSASISRSPFFRLILVYHLALTNPSHVARRSATQYSLLVHDVSHSSDTDTSALDSPPHFAGGCGGLLL